VTVLLLVFVIVNKYITDLDHELCDGKVDTIHAEAAKQHETMKAAQFTVGQRERRRLGRVKIKPLQNIK